MKLLPPNFFFSNLLVAKVDFVHQVMPILKKNCAECHTDGKKKGGLSMNTRSEFLAGGEGGEIAVPGNADDSWFLELTSSTDLDERMPPKGPGVSKEEIEILRQWVNEGMVWEEGITLGSSGWEPKLKPRIVKLPLCKMGETIPSTVFSTITPNKIKSLLLPPHPLVLLPAGHISILLVYCQILNN